MGIQKVVEPAIAVEEGEISQGTDVNVKEVEKEDTVCFPHIDTCVGIALVLEDGRKIAAHVSQTKSTGDFGFAQEENYNKAIQEIKSKLGNAKVASVTIIPGSQEWNNVIDTVELAENFKTKNVTCLKSGDERNIVSGMDVYVDSENVTICKSPKDSKKKDYNKITDIVDEQSLRQKPRSPKH